MKTLQLFFVLFILMINYNSSIAQLSQSSCKEILSTLDPLDFKYISIVPFEDKFLTLDAPKSKWIFKDNYLIIQGALKDKKLEYFIPYSNIKMIVLNDEDSQSYATIKFYIRA